MFRRQYHYSVEMFKILFLFTSIYFTYAKHEQYDGHSLYGVKVYNNDQVNKLMQIIERLNLDIWTYPNPSNEGAVLVPSTMKPVFEDEVKSIGGTYRIDVENIKPKLELEDELMAEAYTRCNISRSLNSGLSFDTIHRYAVVDKYLSDVAHKYSRVARVVNAGKSVEGRDIRYLRLSTNNFTDSNKPVVVMQSLLHAREWITLPVTLWVIQKLITDVADDHHDLIRDIDWIILPIANPDGYEYTHNSMRMWRKNRRTGFSCVGVDLNRNYDFNWGVMSSNNSCSDTFHGPGAFSEPETIVTKKIVDEFKNRIGLFLDIHSYGSLILFGYGNRQLPANSFVLNKVAVDMARRIDSVKWRQNRNYRVGNIAQVLYLASGSSTDYVQTAIGNRLSFTFELPAYKNHNLLSGFLVDPLFIRQACFETWEGIKVAVRYVLSNKDNLYATSLNITNSFAKIVTSDEY